MNTIMENPNENTEITYRRRLAVLQAYRRMFLESIQVDPTFFSERFQPLINKLDEQIREMGSGPVPQPDTIHE